MVDPPATNDSDVAVVIVNYRTPELTKRCLASLSAERVLVPNLRVMVVDGASGDESAEVLAAAIARPQFAHWVSFIQLPINGGYGWANNEAICRLMMKPRPPNFIHVLNPDTEIEPGAVAALAQYLESHPRAAAVGSQLIEADNSLTGSAFNFPTVRGEFSRGARIGAVDRLLRVPPISVVSTSAAEVDWTTGASVMFRSEALRQTGLFDEGFFLYHEELELMWRLRRAGWTIAFEPRSRVRHIGGVATGMGSQNSAAPVESRSPAYWYRSRSRYFALTRGRPIAALAFMTWLLGYIVWIARRSLGLAPSTRPRERALRDHLLHSFPRRRDRHAAIRAADSPPGSIPAWMQRGL